MKKILITAENSYIGNAFADWTSERYKIDFISCRNDKWKELDFSIYDVVFHVAGIAHTRETKENSNLYFKVNRDLTIALAMKAKDDGVKHFIFLSSMSVYGIERGVIRKDSIPNPTSNYGISKLQAEEKIISLNKENFKIAILRVPMVYGKNCKGNYPRLAKVALKLPVIPAINNQRSMIYIDNLSEFVKVVIENSMSGIYLPQNSEYTNTSEMIRLIAEVHEKKIVLTKLANPLLRLLCRKSRAVNKVFGNLVFEQCTSNYCVVGLKESIKLTEGDMENWRN